MPRLFFDVTSQDGTVERDSTGVMVLDIVDALHECLDTKSELLDSGAARVLVRNENDDVLMELALRALSKSIGSNP